jgi:hypothetical protein
MDKLSRTDLYSLEEYAAKRKEFRARVMEHKRNRKVLIGPHATLYFEDRLTIQYQIQEMLRSERIFEAEGIEDELQAYNPLIPEGSNWKATFMIEFSDPEERKVALARMVDIENHVWVQVEGLERLWAIADEDLERSTEQKTSAVHFLRFELTPEMAAKAKNGGLVAMGIDLPTYSHTVSPLPDAVRISLVQDLD